MANLTPEASRAARAILHWCVSELADEAGVAFTTVHRFEKTGVATETTNDSRSLFACVPCTRSQCEREHFLCH